MEMADMIFLLGAGGWVKAQESSFTIRTAKDVLCKKPEEP